MCVVPLLLAICKFNIASLVSIIVLFGYESFRRGIPRSVISKSRIDKSQYEFHCKFSNKDTLVSVCKDSNNVYHVFDYIEDYPYFIMNKVNKFYILDMVINERIKSIQHIEVEIARVMEIDCWSRNYN